MSVWKKIPIAPGGVMPGGLVTKIGVAAISLLLAATLLTYTFTGGGGPEAEIDVPEAAGFDLQQRAAAAIEAEARRQAEQLRQQATAAERQLAQLQNEQESTAALLGAGIVGLPGQDPGTGLLADDQAVPFGGEAPRTEAEAVLLETLRLEEMERRRRSLRTAPLVLSYRNSEAAGRPSSPEDFPVGFRPPRLPRPPHPPSQPKAPFPRPGSFSNCSPNSTTGNWPRQRRPAASASGSAPSLARLGPEAETPVVGRPTDPDGWERIYEGSFLEAVLVTELSGEFPGPVLANVSVPFYSADRQRVLIPRGARVVGSVQAVSGADQERLAVAFHRIIWPDGRSVSLEFNGLNQIGESALKDAVDRHYFSMFAAAGAVGILSGLTAMGSNPYAGAVRVSRPEPAKGLGKVRCGFSTASSTACPPSRFARATACASGSPAMFSCRGNPNRPEASNDDETRDRFLSHPRCGRCHAAGRERAVRPGPASDRDYKSDSADRQSGHALHDIAQSIHEPGLFGAGHGGGRRGNPVDEAAVVCDTLNMIGAFKDSYQQLLAAPTDLLNTPVPLPDWRDVLQAADTVTAADIRNIYQSGPNGADAAVATFERRRDYADRSVVLSHAQADAAAALTATLDEAEAAVADLEAHNSVTRTGLGQTQLAATLTRADYRGAGRAPRLPNIRPGGGCLQRGSRAPGDRRPAFGRTCGP